MKKIFGIVILIIIIVAGVVFWQKNKADSPQLSATDYRNVSYEIGGQNIKLVNGRAETEIAAGSSSVLITEYFGNLAKGDLNGDTIPDLAFVITQSGGGSGTFYYGVASIQNSDGSYKGTNAVLLGDRVAPQSTEISEGLITFNYAERKPGEAMTVAPSVGVSKKLQVHGGQLEEALPDNVTYTNATANLIVVELPFPGAVVGKEFKVIGKARGNWYFEASFPVSLLDKNGKVIFEAPAQAKDEWMTENFVPFEINVKVPNSYIGPATLVLKKDNASGLPEHDASISFPISIEY
jgi:hypothetical protein